MPIQDGFVRLRKGTIDNISFVKTKDGYMAKKVSRISAESRLTNKNYDVTRKHMSEFGRAGQAVKLLRRALEATIKNTVDSRVTGRFTKLMKAVVIADKVNDFGERMVTDPAVKLLKGFDFNVSAELSAVFPLNYTGTVDRAAGTITLNVPGFVVTSAVRIPPGATHFKLLAAGVDANFIMGEEQHVHFETAPIPVNNSPVAPIPIILQLAAGSSNPLLAVLGINFYILVNNSETAMHNAGFNAMAIVLTDVLNG